MKRSPLQAPVARAATEIRSVTQYVPGVACVAASIQAGPTVVAAYSVSAPLARFRERRRWLTDAVHSAALAGVAAIPQERLAGRQ